MLSAPCMCSFCGLKGRLESEKRSIASHKTVKLQQAQEILWTENSSQQQGCLGELLYTLILFLFSSRHPFLATAGGSLSLSKVQFPSTATCLFFDLSLSPNKCQSGHELLCLTCFCYSHHTHWHLPHPKRNPKPSLWEGKLKSLPITITYVTQEKACCICFGFFFSREDV